MPTPTGIRLEIGGVRFHISPPPGLSLVEDQPLYRSFVDPSSDGPECDADATVSLALGAGPDLTGRPAQFATDESWTLYREKGTLILRFRGPGDDPSPLWVAEISTDSREPYRSARVHCGAHFVAGDRLTNPVRYPLDQLLMGLALAPLQGVVCHAAGVVGGRGGVLFGGPSGAGKTTLMRLLREHADFEPGGLSDDRLVIRRRDQTVTLYGTPWAGEGRVAANRSAPLTALVFLHHAAIHRLEPLEPTAALARLLKIASVPWHHEPAAMQTLELLDWLAGGVAAYDFGFRPEPGALEALAALL